MKPGSIVRLVAKTNEFATQPLHLAGVIFRKDRHQTHGGSTTAPAKGERSSGRPGPEPPIDISKPRNVSSQTRSGLLVARAS